MSHYKHLTLIERERILFFRAQGYGITFIANKIGRNKSTVSRELRRNLVQGEYIPALAAMTYRERRKACRPRRRLSNSALLAKVKDMFLNHQWSPEEIAGRMCYEGKKLISCTTIYREIYAGTFNEPGLSRGNRGAIRKLRHRGKTRHTKGYVERRGKIKISHLISERPKEADERARLGDWEADTVACKEGMSCLVTLTDRKSRFLLCKKAEKKSSVYVTPVMIECLKNQPLHSVTPDRGKEFAYHEDVTAALNDVPFYFPLPHHPWQRGTNENTNGLLREYFPRSTDITNLADEWIQSKVDELNHRPRKCLGYQTPYEVYYSVTLHLT